MGILTKLFQEWGLNRQYSNEMNVNAKHFQPRRNAAAIADLPLKDQAATEQKEPYIFANSIIKWGSILKTY